MSRYFFPLFSIRRQSGDTIVEVIIAIAIVSSMLVGAFAVSNHSTKTVRDSEEHSQALSLLQGQLEALRAAIKSGTDDASKFDFCMDQGSPPAEKDISDLTHPCEQRGDSKLYKLEIKRVTSGPTTTFALRATWDSLLGGTGQQELFYRAYPSS